MDMVASVAKAAAASNIRFIGLISLLMTCLPLRLVTGACSDLFSAPSPACP
jgi:hypothetical protein